jgi:predicted acyl esterase
MSHAADVQTRTEIRDGMKITWHQGIVMDDGLRLDADVFAPIEDGRATGRLRQPRDVALRRRPPVVAVGTGDPAEGRIGGASS